MISRLINSMFRFFRSKDLKSDNKDHLETLTPDELGELLHLELLYSEIIEDPPDNKYIKDLLDVGCLIDSIGSYGNTALCRAAQYRHLDLVKLLVSKGAEVNAKNNDEYTPLHHAVSCAYDRPINIEIVKFLISLGADVNAKNRYGHTAWDNTPIKIQKYIPELNPMGGIDAEASRDS